MDYQAVTLSDLLYLFQEGARMTIDHVPVPAAETDGPRHRRPGRARTLASTGRSSGSHRLRRACVLTAVAALSISPALAQAVDGGSGGTSGGAGWGAAGKLGVVRGFFDDAVPGRAPTQGWGQSSIDWFVGKAGVGGKYMASQLQASCTQALTEATQRAAARGVQGAKSRVVGIMYATNNGVNGGAAARSAEYFYDEVDAWRSSGYTGFTNDSTKEGIPNLAASLADQGVRKTSGKDKGNAFGEPYVTTVCVALNETEPMTLQGYDLQITTDHASVVTEAGSSSGVTDTIHAVTSGTKVGERLMSEVVLNYDGPEGTKQAVKQVPIHTNQDTRTPEFTPADFGWTTWPATVQAEGKGFWFDVRVPKQGKMKAAVDTADRDKREMWKVAPTSPTKTITNGTTGAQLGNTDVLASGMFYDANIVAHANGYSSRMVITDTVDTDKVWIGGRDADDTSKVTVTGPDGQVVSGAQVSVERSGGKTVVSAVLTDLAQGAYTLKVPTYVQPTGSDYQVTDAPKVCYGSDASTCLEGSSKTTRKVTPRPDKVWTLDEAGALTASDPQGTNQVAADQKVFLPGDGVAAVVNGSIKAGLQQDLEAYSIADDWSDASRYVDFGDASLARVYLGGQDVTDQFSITVKDGVTTAVAKKEFLARTHGLGQDTVVKLVVQGRFRTDYRTDGQTVRMENKGFEVYNNETVRTNTPPVFTWTPDPHKQVIGSGEQDGSHRLENVEGMSVLPGQKVQYTVQLDLRVPGNAARGIKSLGVKDVYDSRLEADAKSIEVYDSRTGKAVPSSSYKIDLNEDAHTFSLTFTEDFIKANTQVDSLGGVQWKDGAVLTMRFAGTVKGDTPDGSTLTNTAFQLVNGVETRTETPVVRTPSVKPDKEDLSTNDVDIDGKTVVAGDVLRYRLTLAAKPETELAYHVHKLGMVDDFDEEYLSLDAAGVRVVGKTSGKDVTDRFNIQVKDGVLYVFAKQVDSVNAWGQTVKGDPQPEDLAAYDAADIVQGRTPIIDQSLLGEDYYVIADTKVVKEKDGYTIRNQARENLENTVRQTKIVSNPLKDIDPSKDVVADESSKEKSVNGTEIKLDSTFSYRLRSSEIPAGRAYGVSDWQVADTFDKVHDSYTGMWAVYADTDVYDGDRLVFHKGDLLSDSAGHEGETYGALFTATWDAEAGRLVVTATDAYEKLVNTRPDLAQAWSVYTRMERIAPAERIVNTFDETYNGTERHSNEVWTTTAEHPGIDVEKYTLFEGLEKGDRDDAGSAYQLKPVSQTDGSKDASAVKPEDSTPVSPHEDVQVGFKVTNTGDVDLKNVSLTDKTLDGTTGSVGSIMCELPVEQAGQTADAEAGGALATGADQRTKTIKVAGDKIGLLRKGQSVECTGTLTGTQAGTTHSDTATVIGASVYTGAQVSDSDDWHAVLAAPDAPPSPAPSPEPSSPSTSEPGPTPSAPQGPGKGAVTGQGIAERNWWLAGLGALFSVVGVGAAWETRRRLRAARVAGPAGTDSQQDQ